jgi:hypothetical protein
MKLTPRVLRLDVESGIADFEEHAVNRYSGPHDRLRLDYTHFCCDGCERSRAEQRDGEWLEFLRALDVYPAPVLARPLLR